MNTEIKETIRGYVFYDGKCPLCRRWVNRVYGPLLRRGYHPIPLQAPWARQTLNLKDGDSLREMKLLTSAGMIYGGADALVQIAGFIWWLWPLFLLAQITGAKGLLRKAYMRLAANRPCDDGLCAVPTTRSQKHHHITSRFFELP